MLSWITSWWVTSPSSTEGSFTGPARNAPNNGENIKQLLEEKPQMMNLTIITNIEIQNARQRLKSPVSHNVPDKPRPLTVLQQLAEIHERGSTNYFESIKKRRHEKLQSKPESNIQAFEDIKVKRVENMIITTSTEFKSAPKYKLEEIGYLVEDCHILQ